jgi:NAD(P)-dependent dehydrogenase (short-subunit alcohol dehydrogenase family)
MFIDNSLRDKVVLVTGGGSGLGAAVCETLAQEGMKVIVADLKLEKANIVVQRIEKSGGKAIPFELDVRKFSDLAKKIDFIIKKFGQLDVLVNNAGVDLTTSIEDMPIKKWNQIIETNLTGPFVLSKEALIHMKNKSGHIINIVSTAAKRSWANASAYHASKWGLLGFSHALHVEGRVLGVKVTAVICGGMKTPFLIERFPDIDTTTLQDPSNVAGVIKNVLLTPGDSVIPEIMVLPMKESSWP